MTSVAVVQDPIFLPARAAQVLSFTGLRFEATLGVLSHERVTPQPISVDVDLNLGAQPMSPKGDDIRSVLDYRLVRRIIIDECTSEHINLLETLIGRVAQRLFRLPGVLGVRLKIAKLEIFEDCEVAIRMQSGNGDKDCPQALRARPAGGRTARRERSRRALIVTSRRAAGPRILVDFISPGPGTPPLRAAFDSPTDVLSADSPREVQRVLDAVEAYARAGLWCVGFVRYEAAAAFDSALVTHSPNSGPVAWFGVFDGPTSWWDEDGEPARVDWHRPLQAGDAREAIADIHRRIIAGEVYQINQTARMRGNLYEGTPRALFGALQRAQPHTYAAYIDTGRQQILSVSPELFFDWREDRTILSRPMKGTAARGATKAEDDENVAALRASVKERAENLMIVDLIRNDLARIAELHSVAVPRLFHAEALPTVWSMTSDVVARTKSAKTLADVFAALFPCGSVTGAPKVQAMKAIHALEPDARGVYCGAVGVVRPGGAATFNVAIRTVEIDDGRRVCCGIGSGITIDATFDGEWAEWRHKASFVMRASAPFSLLETLRIEDGIARNAEAHLARLASSAAHFGYPWNGNEASSALAGLASAHRQGTIRARLLLQADGRMKAEAFSMDDSRLASVRVQLASAPLREAHSEFVRHKTTRREHYDAFTPPPGVFDTLLWNEAGEITEFTRGNVAVKMCGRWLTPPLSSGLLPGIGRAQALGAGELTETVVRVDDLPRVQGIAFLNSLRGWIDVHLVPALVVESDSRPHDATVDVDQIHLNGS